MDNKQKHLEFIQVVISRMANNSFLLKGWSITLLAAIFALSTSKAINPLFVFSAYLPTILFWLLDGYFLQQERLYRSLYDSVRQKTEEEIDFSLDAHTFVDKNEKNTFYQSVVASKTVAAPYAILTIAMFLAVYFSLQ